MITRGALTEMICDETMKFTGGKISIKQLSNILDELKILYQELDRLRDIESKYENLVKEAEVNMFCKHDWKVLSDKVIPATFSMDNIKKFEGRGYDSLFVKKSVTICACKKCGKIKKFVTDNPDALR